MLFYVSYNYIYISLPPTPPALWEFWEDRVNLVTYFSLFLWLSAIKTYTLYIIYKTNILRSKERKADSIGPWDLRNDTMMSFLCLLFISYIPDLELGKATT